MTALCVPSKKSKSMSRAERIVIAIAVFVAFYATLTLLVAPLLTRTGAITPLDAAAIARFPVMIAIRQGADGNSLSYAVTQMRHMQSVTNKAKNYSFLLPPGRNTVRDQDGDAAIYTASEMSPGRQHIRLEAKVGDYTHEVEYEAEEKQAFPLRDGHTGPQTGLLTIPASALLTWIVIWLIRRNSKKG